MKKKMQISICIFSLVLLYSSEIFAQSRLYEGPDDPAGDIAAERIGTMNGNRILLRFQNSSELGNYNEPNHADWPNDENATEMHQNIGLLIGTRVYIENDSIPVTGQSSRTDLDTLYYVQTSYRRDMDRNPEGTIEWGFYPVFGYFNENSEYPATSTLPESWPPLGWPARGNTVKWPGEWNGRFGRGIAYADLETFFVVNDAHDQEYLQPNSPVKYYPKPGVKIGDKLPNVTIQKGLPWGGIGVRVEIRGLQWNNPQARDAIFFEYTIANISEYDLEDMAFGYYIDLGIGGDHPNADVGYFDNLTDMAYAWDADGVGGGGMRPGIIGIAFLESPGIPWDGIDNDDDGLIDEQRDNKAIAKIGPEDGIADLQKFLDWYGMQQEELKEHWDADEDQDWQDGNDVNGNGIYDNGEEPGDDVGTDGVGPGELNYYGPDADGTECNHRPDFQEGLGAEPNFGPTDISESDMLGLTVFKMWSITGFSNLFRHDREFYNVITESGLVEYFGDISNLAQTFSSAPFPLPKGRTERISMCELHSYEPISGLNSPEHSAPALYEKKQIVQFIYNADYRFAQPPKMPTLSAVAGDGKVILSWDDVAEKLTREPMLKGANDFEGYKLYKATDKRMSDAEVLVDVYGNPIGKLPIFQCDLINGKKGITDYGAVKGVLFNLGADTGIQQYFVDEDVQNGRTYYYGLVAYDHGISGMQSGIGPSENNMVIDLDENEEIRFTGKNVQIVIPHQKAAGYVSPSIDMVKTIHLVGTGTLTAKLMNAQDIKPNHTYKVKFDVDEVDHLKLKFLGQHAFDALWINKGFFIYDMTEGDSLVYSETPDAFYGQNVVSNKARGWWYLNTDVGATTSIFDGIQVKINGLVETGEFDPERSGWVVGDAPIRVTPSLDESKYYPWQYDIIFTGEDSAYTSRVKNTLAITNISGIRIAEEQLLLDHVFNFYVLNKSFPDTNGIYEECDLVIHDVNQNGEFDLSEDVILVGHVILKGKDIKWGGTIFSIDFHNIPDESHMPKTDDFYRVDFKRPFVEQDSLMFTVNPAIEFEPEELKRTLDDIKVVPNPYVATNAMEEAVSNPYLNQSRKLLFTHIPAQCTIKIFTISGVLVDEMIVENTPDTGIVHWDMLTREGLEIAAGMYLYHVKSDVTGDEKLGKFAVIK